MGKYDQFKFYEITKQSGKEKKKKDGEDDKKVKYKESEKRKNKNKNKEIDENLVKVFNSYEEIEKYLKKHPDYEIYPFIITEWWKKRGFEKTIFDYLDENKTDWEEEEKNEKGGNKKPISGPDTSRD